MPSEMIVIKDIDYFIANHETMAEICMMEPHRNAFVEHRDGWAPIDCTIAKELIRGRRFIRPSDGTDVVIGMSRQVQNLLGLQYEAWENQSNELASVKISLGRARRTMRLASSAGFFTRLKWLLTWWRKIDLNEEN